jgi:hypothetical protein
MADEPGMAKGRPEGPGCLLVTWLVACFLWPAIVLGVCVLIVLWNLPTSRDWSDLGKGVEVWPFLTVAGVPVSIACFVAGRRRLPRWLLALAVAENVAINAWWMWHAARAGWH